MKSNAKKYIILPLFLLLFFLVPSSPASENDVISLISKVDEVLFRKDGLYSGRMKHIHSNGGYFIVDFKAETANGKSRFSFYNKPRGLQLEVLYLSGGEQMFVCFMHARDYYRKIGVDQYYQVLYTNFSFADFSGRKLADLYTAELLGEHDIGDRRCRVFRLSAVYPWMAYGSLFVFADKESNIPLRIEFLDVNEILSKVLSITKVSSKDDIIVPIRFEMRDIRSGSLTILVLNEFDWSRKFDRSIFKLENLGKLDKL